MVYAISSDGDTMEVQHDEPLVYPEDVAVEAVKRELQWEEVRQQRALLLEAADWRIRRAEDDGQDTTVLRAYRQALRDVTAQDDPWAVAWPAKPWEDSASSVS